MEALYRMWSNTRGQLSWISHALSGCPEFSFADFPCRQVTMGMQRSLPEDETKNIRTWCVCDRTCTFGVVGVGGGTRTGTHSCVCWSSTRCAGRLWTSLRPC